MIESSSHETNDFNERHLPQLLVLQSEFEEVRDYLNELINFVNYKHDPADATTLQKALTEALIISYFRNMKKSEHYFQEHEVRRALSLHFSESELILHKKLEDLRDDEIAHSNAENYDVIIQLEKEIDKIEESELEESPIPYLMEIISTHSMKPTRMPLEPDELEMLSEMVHKIQFKINEIIEGLT